MKHTIKYRSKAQKEGLGLAVLSAGVLLQLWEWEEAGRLIARALREKGLRSPAAGGGELKEDPQSGRKLKKVL